jgi:hypothetical protein
MPWCVEPPLSIRLGIRMGICHATDTLPNRRPDPDQRAGSTPLAMGVSHNCEREKEAPDHHR